MDAVDWCGLFRFLTRLLTQRRWQLSNAEDLAGAAIARTYKRFREEPRRAVGVVWIFAKTTCRRLAATEMRSSVAHPIATNTTMDLPAAKFATEGKPTGSHALLVELMARCRGTQLELVRILRERQATNTELASELEVGVRSIEKAKQALRRKARGILVGRFGAVRLS